MFLKLLTGQRTSNESSKEDVSERFPRGFREVSERFPRGFGKVSARFPRGFREVSERFPRGFREVSERFPRGFREVLHDLSQLLSIGFTIGFTGSFSRV